MQRSKKAAPNPLLSLFTLLRLPHPWHFTFLPALIVTLLLMVIEYVTNENLLTPYWFFTKRQTFLFWLNALLCAFAVKRGIFVSHENRYKIATVKTYISVSFCRARILAVYVRDVICHSRHSRRECKIFASGVNFSRNNAVCYINESKKLHYTLISSQKLLTYY